jgi:putative transposase
MQQLARTDFFQIDQWYPSSKRCSARGHILDALSLDTRQWHCPDCGLRHDRDINSATNILSVGLAILAGADQLRLHEKTTAGHAGR